MMIPQPNVWACCVSATYPPQCHHHSGTTVAVEITNTYECGRESVARVVVQQPTNQVELADWWNDVVWDFTGDGHPCGSSEGSVYTARVLNAPTGWEWLVGKTMEWGAS